MKAQQAPEATASQSLRDSPVKAASKIAQSRKGGIVKNISRPPRTVSTTLSGEDRRFFWIQKIGPSVRTGDGRSGWVPGS
jgi:hypothetical protein